MDEPKFKNYKEKQEYFRSLSKKPHSVYDSGKRTNRKGVVRIKGVPLVNPKKQQLKEERATRKAIRKALKHEQ